MSNIERVCRALRFLLMDRAKSDKKLVIAQWNVAFFSDLFRFQFLLYIRLYFSFGCYAFFSEFFSHSIHVHALHD